MGLFDRITPRGRAMSKAETLIREGETIPLDLFAELLSHGVDINEFERTIRNG